MGDGYVAGFACVQEGGGLRGGEGEVRVLVLAWDEGTGGEGGSEQSVGGAGAGGGVAGEEFVVKG